MMMDFEIALVSLNNFGLGFFKPTDQDGLITIICVLMLLEATDRWL